MSFPNQVVACIEGWEGTHKTSFSLTAPGPIGFINFDRGLARARKPKGKEILVGSYPFRKEGGQSAAEKLWAQAEKDIHDSLDDNRTTVIDTGDLLYECIRMAHLGQLEKVRERYYGSVNRAMNDIYDHAYDSGNHLLVIHPLAEDYKGDSATGNYVPKGWKQTRYRVNHRVLLEVEEEHYRAIIIKPKEMKGQVIEQPTFQDVAMTLFPNADEEEFEDA